jgi:hypothetical protein
MTMYRLHSVLVDVETATRYCRFEASDENYEYIAMRGHAL